MIGATKAVNDIVDKDKNLQALISKLRDRNVSFSVQVGAIPDKVPHDANSAAVAQIDFDLNGTGNILYVDMDKMMEAIASGQDGGQILFMELEHFLYGTLGTGQPRLMPIRFESPQGGIDPGIATVTIGGQTYTFDLHLITTSVGPDGKPKTQSVSPGYFDEQHAQIHNDIIDKYGVDKTGAAAEATGHQPKDQWTKDNAKTKFEFDSQHGLPPPDLSKNCADPSNGMAIRVASIGEIDDGSGPPVDFAYFWAEY